jgi:prophage regulatory protein
MKAATSPSPTRARRVGRLAEIASTKTQRGLVPASPASIWRWSKQGKFPRPFKISENVTVWDLDEIDAFLLQRAGGHPA